MSLQEEVDALILQFPPWPDTQIVESPTGGKKGSKLAQRSLLPARALTELAEHAGKGEQKYPTAEDGIVNWRHGYDWSLSFDALDRHLSSFWDGEDVDPESGTKHIIAVAWHALVLATFMDEQRQYDNRFATKHQQKETKSQ